MLGISERDIAGKDKGFTYEELVVSSSFELPPLLFDFFFFRASRVFSTGFASVRVMKRSVAIKMKKRILRDLQTVLVLLYMSSREVLWVLSIWKLCRRRDIVLRTVTTQLRPAPQLSYTNFL
jgi:hypothetical protein